MHPLNFPSVARGCVNPRCVGRIKKAIYAPQFVQGSHTPTVLGSCMVNKKLCFFRRVHGVKVPRGGGLEVRFVASDATSDLQPPGNVGCGHLGDTPCGRGVSGSIGIIKVGYSVYSSELSYGFSGCVGGAWRMPHSDGANNARGDSGIRL